MLVEKPLVKKLNVPPLLQAIIENDAALRLTKSSAVVSLADYKDQTVRKRDYIRAAEKKYAGTKNEGTEI